MRRRGWFIAHHQEDTIDTDPEYDVFVGVDWGSEEHHACVVDPRGKKVGTKVVRHDGTALSELASWLESFSAPPRVAVAIETPRGAVVEMLIERGFIVHHINPKQLDRFRDRHSVAGAKSDRLDSYVLANSLRTDRPLFHRIVPADDDVVELREYLRQHEDLTRDLNGDANRMREQLARYFPQALELCPGADEPWFWALLSLVPTPTHAERVKETRISLLLKEHGIRRLKAPEILAALRKPPLRVSTATVNAAVSSVRLLIERLRLASRQEANVRRAAEAVVKRLAKPVKDAEPGQSVEHRDAAVLLSLPGVGWKVAATMLVEGYEAIADRDYRAMRALAGVAPVTKQTGKNRKGRPQMRQAANLRLRNAHYHWARVSSQHDPTTKDYYADLRKRGHSHGRALRSVADRNLRLLFAMLREHALFDAERPSRRAPKNEG